MDLVAQMGMEALPPEYKNPEILHILFCERDKINAGKELRTRIETAPLTPEGVFNLILRLTGDRFQADKAQAQAILDSTRTN